MNEREPTGNERAAHLSSEDNRLTEKSGEPSLPSVDSRQAEKETTIYLPSENIRPTRRRGTPSISPAEVDILEAMPLHPDATDQAVAETKPPSPEPLERDSLEWRRWFVLAGVQRASGPLTPAQYLEGT